VAVPVVDRLEAVEVDIHEHRRRAVALHEGDRARGLALEAAAVEHVEHGVGIGALLELGHRPFGADELLAQPRDLRAQLVRRHGVDIGRIGSGLRGHQSHSPNRIPAPRITLSPCQRRGHSYNAALPSAGAAESGGKMPAKPVAIILGSQSDWATMKHAAETLDALSIGYDARIVSAHRTPKRLYEFAHAARDNGFKVIIAGAGGAAHLPGMTAAMTPLPVLGVPMNTHALEGKDTLLSIMQMPGGVPVGTLAIGKAGAINAALLAAGILALSDGKVAKRLDAWRARQT